MKQNPATWIKRILWCVIWVFLSFSAIYAVVTSKIVDDFHCGNTVLDPLFSILNWGSPLSLGAAIGLMMLARTGTGRMLYVVVGVLLAIAATVGLAQFGMWYHAEPLENRFQLSNGIWWLGAGEVKP